MSGWQRNAKRVARSRRGVAVILALGLLAITLTISYTLLRTQSTSSMIQANANRTAAARQAALTGIHVALRKIHEPDWQGVEVPVTGQLNEEDSYKVTFITGDSSLAPDDPLYGEYPYRLTLHSVGTSADPSDRHRRAEHTAEVVVQLVRERLAASPPAWEELQAHTLTQWDDSEVEVHFPCRIEGPVRLNGALSFCEDIPPKVRPFDGQIDEVAILADDLSEAELLDLYQGNATYADHIESMVRWWRFNEPPGTAYAAESKRGLPGVYEGAESGAPPAPFGGTGSARFDGEVDGVAVGSVDCIGPNMTLLAWLKADDFGENEGRIISKAQGTDESDHWWMLSTVQQSGAHRLRFRLKSLFGSTKTLIANQGNLTPGQWYFAAATFNGFRMRLYLNGQEVGSTSHFGWVGIDPLVPTSIGENGAGGARGMMFRHMQQMTTDGYEDRRPFSGPLTVRSTTLDDATRSLLAGELAVSLDDDPTNAPVDYSSFAPPAVSEYRLYPGGKTYHILELNGRIGNQELKPEADSNPLGVYRSDSPCELQSKSYLRGILLASQDVRFKGTNIRVEGVDLPPLQSSAERIQLPCLCTGRRLDFSAESTSEAEGMLVVSDATRFQSSGANMTVSLSGRLVTGGLEIQAREPFASASEADWQEATKLFEQQRFSESGTAYFPQWLEQQGMSINPHITIGPPSDTIRYHWHDWSQPLFLPAEPDDGLRWTVVRWYDAT